MSLIFAEPKQTSPFWFRPTKPNTQHMYTKHFILYALAMVCIGASFFTNDFGLACFCNAAAIAILVYVRKDMNKGKQGQQTFSH